MQPWREATVGRSPAPVCCGWLQRGDLHPTASLMRDHFSALNPQILSARAAEPGGPSPPSGTCMQPQRLTRPRYPPYIAGYGYWPGVGGQVTAATHSATPTPRYILLPPCSACSTHHIVGAVKRTEQQGELTRCCQGGVHGQEAKLIAAADTWITAPVRCELRC
ncbi:hypothetical protein BC834DRAFT_462683 [Gloeopeniophorella convolvens]|nr:hypothetical protein BC834DRAFT_462683 [Gloeopeniophorella convolvens]